MRRDEGSRGRIRRRRSDEGKIEFIFQSLLTDGQCPIRKVALLRKFRPVLGRPLKFIVY